MVMKLSKNAKGFTLLEILIVLVILAVIAGLAIPAYTKSVARSKSQEALTVIGTLRGSLARYYAQYNTWNGVTLASLDFDPNQTTAGQVANWTYSIPAAAVNTYTISALFTGTGGAGTITMTNAGVRGGTGDFA